MNELPVAIHSMTSDVVTLADGIVPYD